LSVVAGKDAFAVESLIGDFNSVAEIAKDLHALLEKFAFDGCGRCDNANEITREKAVRFYDLWSHQSDEPNMSCAKINERLSTS